MNNVQGAINEIRRAIQYRIEELKVFEAMATRIDSSVLIAANGGGIKELELLLTHLPEEKKI